MRGSCGGLCQKRLRLSHETIVAAGGAEIKRPACMVGSGRGTLFDNGHATDRIDCCHWIPVASLAA